MLEVEVKYLADDLANLEIRLKAIGAEKGDEREDVDHYFNAPDRDFAKTDEALRVRRIGLRNIVTYKGPRRDPLTKTRSEIEVALADGEAAAEDFARLLTTLGYHPVAVVRKTRRLFGLVRSGFHVEVTLDQVDGVGTYIELEIQTSEEQLDAARDVVFSLASELGLSRSERCSYLELLLSARGGDAS